MGRFITTDPVGSKDGMNLYKYVHNNPTNAIDSSGFEAYYVNEESTSSQSEIDTDNNLYSVMGMTVISGGRADPCLFIRGLPCRGRERILEKRRARYCRVKCPVIKIKPNVWCIPYTYGTAWAYNLHQACKWAEQVARNSTLWGCRTRHCRVVEAY